MIPISSTVLNHLFEQNSWAFRQLQPFAGCSVAFYVGPIRHVWQINGQGRLVDARGQGEVDLSCRIMPTLLPAVMLRDESVIAALPFNGDPDLAAVWRLILANLQWDAAEDLSRLTGDIVAENVVQRVQQSAQQLQLPEKVKDWTSRPLPGSSFNHTMLVSCAEAQQLTQGIEQLQQQLDALEQRLQQIGPDA